MAIPYTFQFVADHLTRSVSAYPLHITSNSACSVYIVRRIMSNVQREVYLLDRNPEESARYAKALCYVCFDENQIKV